jgi:6-phosphofructokinase 1
VFTTQTLATLFEDQGGGSYVCKTASLGHMQQGGAPSGLDRCFGSQLADVAVKFLEEQRGKEEPQSAAIGMTETSIKPTPFEQLIKQMDWKKRVPKTQWWMDLIPLLSFMTIPPLDHACTPRLERRTL